MPVQVKCEPPEALYVTETRDGHMLSQPMPPMQSEAHILSSLLLPPPPPHHVMVPPLPSSQHQGHFLGASAAAAAAQAQAHFAALGPHRLGSMLPLPGDPGLRPSTHVIAPVPMPPAPAAIGAAPPVPHGPSYTATHPGINAGPQGSARTTPAQLVSGHPTISQGQAPGSSHPTTQTPQVKESQVIVGGKPQIDSSSAIGAFGWATVDGVNIPYLLRDTRKYVAVRMVEMKLLSKYPSSYPEELKNRPPLMSHYITANEVKLLNEINVEHCAYEYGRHLFTTQDLIVKLADFEEFYVIVKRHFPDTKPTENPKDGAPKEKEVSPSSSKGVGPSVGGWLQLNNTVVPYVCRKNSKFVPLSVIRYAAGLLADIPVEGHDPTELECSYFNGSCSSAGLNFQFTRSTKLVSIEVVRNKCQGLVVKELPKDDPFTHASYQPLPEEQIISQQPEIPPVTSAPLAVSSASDPVPPTMQPTLAPPPIGTFPAPAPAPAPGLGPTERMPPVGGGYWMNPHLGIFPGMPSHGIPPVPGILPPVGAMGPPGTSVPSAAMASHNANLGLPASVLSSSHPPVNSVPDLFSHIPPKAGKAEGAPKENAPVSPTIAASHGRRRSSSGTPQTRSPGAQSAGSATPSLPSQSPGVPNPHLAAMSAMNSTGVSAGQTISTPAMQHMMAAAAAASQARMQFPDAHKMPPLWQSMQNNQAEMFRMLHMMPPRPHPPPGMMSPGMPPGMPPGPNMVALANLAATKPPDFSTIGTKGVFPPPLSTPGFHDVFPGGAFPRLHTPEITSHLTLTSSSCDPVQSLPPLSLTSVPVISPPNPVSSQYTISPSVPSVTSPHKTKSVTTKPTASLSDTTPRKKVVPKAHADTSSKLSEKTSVVHTKLDETGPVSLDTLPHSSNSKHSSSKEKSKSKFRSNGLVPDAVQITPLEFQGKILSCIVKDNEPYALVEAIAKVFFPYCSLVEVGYAMETVLDMPLLTLTLEEEKAFIRFYGLRIDTLTCNQAVSLKDFIDFMPQLKYMFKEKELEHNSKEGGKSKTNKPAESSGSVGQVSPGRDQEAPAIGESNSGEKKKGTTYAALRAHLNNKRVVSSLPSPPHPAKQPRRLEDTVNRLKLQHVTSEVPEPPRHTAFAIGSLSPGLSYSCQEENMTSEVPEPPTRRVSGSRVTGGSPYLRDSLPTTCHDNGENSDPQHEPMTSEVPEPPHHVTQNLHQPINSEAQHEHMMSEVPEPPRHLSQDLHQPITSEAQHENMTSEVPEPPRHLSQDLHQPINSEVPEAPSRTDYFSPSLGQSSDNQNMISEVQEPPHHTLNGDLTQGQISQVVLNVPQLPLPNHAEQPPVQKSSVHPPIEEDVKSNTLIVNDNNNGEEFVICID